MPQSIKAVDIFSVGKWNGTTITEKDLDDIVDAFESTKEHAKPMLKLGHNDDQKMLADDGLPAAGWIENLRIEGDKLVCDFIDLPEKVYKLIVDGSYRYVSSEIFWNIEINGKEYRRMLSGCALLGTEMPAVMGLNDFANLYKLDARFIRTYTLKKEGNNIEANCP